MQGKIIVITGAGNGLGHTLADTFEQAGAKVIRSDLHSSKEVMGADVRNEKDLERVLDETLSKYGRIDYWINNAGIWLPPTSFENIELDKWREVFDVNVFGAVNGMRLAVKQMKTQNSGTIINIISTAALTGRPLHSAYSASKHALQGATDSVREELKDTGVKVVGVYPGGIKTNLFKDARPSEFEDFLTPEYVAERIIANLNLDEPEENLILKSPNQLGLK